MHVLAIELKKQRITPEKINPVFLVRLTSIAARMRWPRGV